MCDATAAVDVVLPATGSASRCARDVLRESYCPAHNPGVLEAATLLVSELVSNAVRHGRPPVRLHVECSGPGLRVAVSDAGSGVPRTRSLVPLAESGRGIELVRHLSDAWGVEPGAVGKTVWFTIASG